MAPITAEQFTVTLENMARAWEDLPEDTRLPKDEEKSFFDDCKQTCLEIIQRWHSGESSHQDREELAAEYKNSPEGAEQLRKDLYSIREDPFVAAADLNLRLVKYTAVPRD
uniref:Uncharacterized protein n=1 Tax=Spumella elongata TaxID=89044 RepID=A0A7S3LYM7_9STRA|mmetsp:Transcript_144539/g.463153  ORF Transcript_144539/g.463153 Transcript_144539/m.463153 type:complete len:111 (+) Transcript_144539:114-446(+)